MRLTVLFDSAYWVAILEEDRDGYLYAARFIFGAEPSDEQVYEFVQGYLLELQSKMTRGVASEETAHKKFNPKRAQREVRREIAKQGITSEAQEAMRLQIEADKKARQTVSREEREKEREYKYQLAIEKKRKKQRGH